MNEFSTQFTQFKEFEVTTKLIIYSHTMSFEKINLKAFEWLNLNNFEILLVDFQNMYCTE